MENHVSAGSLEFRKQPHEISLLASSTPKTRIFSRAGFLAHGAFHLYRTFPTPRRGPFQPAAGSVVPASWLRPGGFWSRRRRCSPLTVAGATPDFHRLPSLGCRSPARASAPGKLLCYSMKIYDGSQIEGLARPASPLVCAGLPRASGPGANANTRMVYLFPSRPRPG